MTEPPSLGLPSPQRWAWAEIDLDAIEHNVRVLRNAVAPSELWAVVKANGYGHGAVPAAQAALSGGADGLCVAFVQEGVELRRAGVDARILVLSEQPAAVLQQAVDEGLELTVYTDEQVARLGEAGARRHPVHLKIDTGMRRVGVSPADAVALARRIDASPYVERVGLMTHLAVADMTDDPYTAGQLASFDAVLAELDAAGARRTPVHIANSAGALAHVDARRSYVRAGIAIYGLSPGPGVDHLVGELRPALSLHTRVSFVKRLTAGERVSYGLRHRFAVDSNVATLPLGYADGVPRRLHMVGGEVLIGGVRRLIVGAITMDQLMVDCGDDDVQVGEEAVLLGVQGDERIGAAEWAARLDTIAYEIVCGLSARVPRHYVGGPAQHR